MCKLVFKFLQLTVTPKKKKTLQITIRLYQFFIIEYDYQPALHEKNNSLQPILLVLTGKSYSKSKLATHRIQKKRSQEHMYKCFARNMQLGIQIFRQAIKTDRCHCTELATMERC